MCKEVTKRIPAKRYAGQSTSAKPVLSYGTIYIYAWRISLFFFSTSHSISDQQNSMYQFNASCHGLTNAYLQRQNKFTFAFTQFHYQSEKYQVAISRDAVISLLEQLVKNW